MSTDTPPSSIERVEALFEKQLTFMEDDSLARGALPFVPSGDTQALRDLAATLGHLYIAASRARAQR